MASFSHSGVHNPSSNRMAFSVSPLRENDIIMKHPRNDDYTANTEGSLARPTSTEPCRGGDILCTLPSVGGAMSKSPVGMETMHQECIAFLTKQVQGEFYYAMERDRSGNGSVTGHNSWTPQTWYEPNNGDGATTFPSIKHRRTDMNVFTGTQPVPFIPFQDSFSVSQYNAKTINRRAFIDQNAAREFLSFCCSNNTYEFFSICTKVGLMLLACFSSCEMTKSRWGILILCCTLFFKTP